MMTEVEAQQEAHAGEEARAALAEATIAGLRGDALREAVKELMAAQALTQIKAAREMGRSASALNQWLKGSYSGAVAEVEEDARRWLAGYERARRLGLDTEMRVFKTRSGAAYQATLLYAQTAGQFGVIYGESGLGKTVAVRAYAAANPNVWVATASPAESRLVPFLRLLGRAVGVNQVGTGASDVTDAIVGKVRGTRGLIVVDEADHVDLQSLEQLRSIHDRTNVGVCLVGNETVYSQLTGGARRAEFARLYSRIGKRQRALSLPEDAEAIAKGLGVSGKDELAFLREIGKRPGHLRNVHMVLRQAKLIAKGKGVPVTREHLDLAWANLAVEA